MFFNSSSIAIRKIIISAFVKFLLVSLTSAKIIKDGKEEFCAKLECNEEDHRRVCGIREEGDGYRLKSFDNVCQLLRFGCEVPDHEAYVLVKLEYCERAFSENEEEISNNTLENRTEENPKCSHYICPNTQDLNYTCALRQDGNGYKIRLFKNNCQLQKFNCENDVKFEATDDYLCKDVEMSEHDEVDVPPHPVDGAIKKNLFVVHANLLNGNDNINETIENFFAATHIFDLPVGEIEGEETRRMHLKKIGPVKVFKPKLAIPQNRSDDYYHRPTLNSCFHKCPSKCPDTYAPVCGNPGNMAREPSLMFQNHCFMDVAQCKMHWEDKSPTSESSSYFESTFVFCLGEELNNMYRFLPLVRTLQHMGRLKKKGRFHYKLNNMRFFNNLLKRNPKIMG